MHIEVTCMYIKSPITCILQHTWYSDNYHVYISLFDDDGMERWNGTGIVEATKNRRYARSHAFTLLLRAHWTWVCVTAHIWHFRWYATIAPENVQRNKIHLCDKFNNVWTVWTVMTSLSQNASCHSVSSESSDSSEHGMSIFLNVG